MVSPRGGVHRILQTALLPPPQPRDKRSNDLPPVSADLFEELASAKLPCGKLCCEGHLRNSDGLLILLQENVFPILRGERSRSEQGWSQQPAYF
ncbi:hypothetical protein H920_09516 [Fukomys damarensis]|uniref:Uncharacterized protein n=1 Tax=Fukomys damarensis TaxID=885580 RepID=A0A091E1X3_FUKDA|nr:hypothetical protein H920_09516 [Fukomys damarensis]